MRSNNARNWSYWSYNVYFLGEVTPASTFMSGKVKVMGDLSKALKLEEVLRAAREADERKAAKNA